MHVLQLGPYPPPHGGVQTNLVAIRRYLLRRGVACSVINLTRHRQADHEGLYFPKSSLGVAWRLLRIPFTIAHLHIGGNIPLRLLLLGMVVSLLPGRKTVLTLHSGGYPSSPEGSTARPRSLRGFVFRRFDRLIAVNQDLYQMFLRFGARPERVRLIPPHSLPSAEELADLPEPLSRFFQAHQPVLLSMGWLEPEYDFPLQIRALGRVRQQHPRAGLVILGGGRLEPALRALTDASGQAPDVLLAGDTPHSVALTAIARCDVFLRTTWYDGDAISVREALHLGTPVVATDNRMRPPGVILFPASEIDQLVQAIGQALASERQPPHTRESDDMNIAAVEGLYREMEGNCR